MRRIVPLLSLLCAGSGCILLDAPPVSVERARLLAANTDFEQVAAGAQAACASSTGGVTACFGDDTDDLGVIDVPDVEFVRVAGSSDTQALFCGISVKDQLRCWGRLRGAANPVQYTPLENPGWVDVTVGAQHACALDESGEVTCWGDNEAFQREVPNQEFATIEAAADHTCGTTTQGTVICWGGGQALPTFLEAIDGQSAWAVAVGEDFACRGKLNGANSTYECHLDLADGVWDTPAIGYVSHAEAGSSHVCVLARGEILCFDANERADAEVAEAGEDWAAVSVGREGACGVTGSGRVVCWGDLLSPEDAGY